jgi:hypothetical protein
MNKTLKFNWNGRKDEALLELATKHEGIWRKIAGEMDDNLSTKNQMTERYGAQFLSGFFFFYCLELPM